jgi:putative SOS response-associated peptidase YedK
MCTLYNHTTNVEAMRRLFGITTTSLPNLPLFGDIYPGREGPIVRAAGGAVGTRELATLVWGFPPPPQGRAPVVNVRNLASPFWRSALANPARRCLVPLDRFSEWTAEPDPATGKKRKVWFALTEDAPFAFAGLWRPGDGPDHPGYYAFLTTEPNSLVGAIHPKAMPVILAPDSYAAWLEAPFAEAAALARPYPADAMRIVEP